MKASTKNSPLKTILALIGVLVTGFLIVDTFNAVNRGGSTEKEGAAKVNAALEELHKVQQKNDN